jgi:DNA-binding NarL/FixJ family response regulator
MINRTDIELVAEASNEREAIEKFRSHRPDVTLMDLQMPDISGIDAILSIRQEFPVHAGRGLNHTSKVLPRHKTSRVRKNSRIS